MYSRIWYLGVEVLLSKCYKYVAESIQPPLTQPQGAVSQRIHKQVRYKTGNYMCKERLYLITHHGPREYRFLPFFVRGDVAAQHEPIETLFTRTRFCQTVQLLARHAIDPIVSQSHC